MSEDETENDIARLRETLRRTKETEVETVREETEHVKNLRKALSLNRALQDKLEVLTRKLVEMYEERRDRIEEIQRELPSASSVETHGDCHSSSRNFGIPYFKDSELFPSPRNSDAVTSSRNGLLNNFSQSSPTNWNGACKSNLEKAVHGLLRRGEKEKLERELNRLNETEPVDENAVSEIKDRLERLGDLTLKDLAGGLNDEKRIDWYRVAAAEGRHSPHECRVMWKMFVHPAINKRPWSEEELHALKGALLRGLRGRDWEDVADALATGRTGFQCFVYSRRLVDDPERYTGPWSEEEDEYLRTLIEECRIGDFIPWNKIAYYLDGRTRNQAYNRYREVHCTWRTGRFLPEEDAVLVAAVNKYGLDHNKIVSHLPGRVTRQTRKRYQTLLSACGGSWTQEEDFQLRREIHDSVCYFEDMDFSIFTEKFPGRSSTQLKARGVLLGANVNDTYIVYADDEVRADTILNKVSKNLLKKLATLEPHKQPTVKSLKNHVTDKFFVNYFKSLHFRKIKSSAVQYPEKSISNISDVKVVLSILQAELNRKNLQSHLVTDESKELLNAVLKPTEQKISTVKQIKTYSRKSVPKPTENMPNRSTNLIESTRDSSAKLQYLFPPSFTILTTLKKCISHFGYDKPHLKSNENNNVHPKIKLWNDRIFVLFYWGMLLTNYTPNCLLVKSQEELGETVTKKSSNPSKKRKTK